MSSPQTDVHDVDVIASAEVRLSESNPDIASEVIHTLVQQAYARMTPAKVHTYLPVLIVREVQGNLRSYDSTRADVLDLPTQRT